MCNMSASTSLFLSLPPELRLRIYHFLFPPSVQIFAIDHGMHPDCRYGVTRTFDDMDANHWWIYAQRAGPRRKYLTKINDSLFVDTRDLPDLNVLLVNRQVHVEAVQIAYQSITFDFETALPALAPFLARLGPYARSAVRSLQMAHTPPTKMNCWDEESAWRDACLYIAQNLRLQTLRVDYRYICGQDWSVEDWRRKLAINDQGLPLDDELSKTLCTNESSAADYVLSISPTGMPQCKDFLETLPIESQAQMRKILKTNPITLQPIDPIFRDLVRVRGLEQLEVRARGGLTGQLRNEVEDFLRTRMLKPEVWRASKLVSRPSFQSEQPAAVA